MARPGDKIMEALMEPYALSLRGELGPGADMIDLNLQEIVETRFPDPLGDPHKPEYLRAMERDRKTPLAPWPYFPQR